MVQLEEKKTLWLFLALSALHMMTVTWGFLQQALSNVTLNYSLIFNGLTWLVYSAVYVLFALLPIYLLSRFFSINFKLTAVLAIMFSSAVLLLMRADLMIYDLYNFHFNGFVWNLVTTRGGVSSLGGGIDTYLAVALSALLTIAVQCGFWLLSNKLTKTEKVRMRWQYMAWLIAPMMLAQAVMYGISDVKNYGPILSAAQTYPFYKKVTFRGLAEKMGIRAVRSSESKLSIDTSRIQYPLNAIKYNVVDRPPNVVLLVAESLRWDRLTPEIMPNTWKLAQKGQFYKQHYSSGNGTREGLFGLFYGLYGSYWNSFLYAQKSPLLMDRLQDLGYQFDLRTSAKFSYPEFNKTLFAKFPLAQLHEEPDSKIPWERDRDNASGLIEFIKNRDQTKSFMSFFFFESTHARYDFPETNVIAKPYLKDVNYWGMSRKSLAPKVGELKNRYTNAAHWVDIQLGRIYDNLESQGLLDNTIIIVTGDHGEEFLEKGFWGHNSSFVEEQTHVPMVMWMPKLDHHEVNQVTSHLDIGTTLMQRLGAPLESKDYSLGTNILNASDRKFIVVSDWHSISVMTNNMKFRIPYVSKGFDHWQPTGQKDETLSSEQSQELMAKNQTMILEAIKNSSKFLATKNN
jgi:uncharacterized protein